MVLYQAEKKGLNYHIQPRRKQNHCLSFLITQNYIQPRLINKLCSTSASGQNIHKFKALKIPMSLRALYAVDGLFSLVFCAKVFTRLLSRAVTVLFKLKIMPKRSSKRKRSESKSDESAGIYKILKRIEIRWRKNKQNLGVEFGNPSSQVKVREKESRTGHAQEKDRVFRIMSQLYSVPRNRHRKVPRTRRK